MDLDIGIIDLQVSIYEGEEAEVPVPKELFRDAESRRAWPSLDIVGYMYGDTTERAQQATDIKSVLQLLDRYGIERAQISVYPTSSKEYLDLIDEHSDRFFAALRLNPHDGYEAVAALHRLVHEYDWVRSVTIAPSILYPPIPPNSREFYPIYSKCVELDIPVMLNVGFPGPRVPGDVQNPMYVDDVAWFFPDLRIVLKHGGEPWADVCVRLLRKWPNVYFATTGFAPRRYPAPILDYLRRSRAHKVMYGGYFPNLGLDRLTTELGDLELDRDRAQRFLRSNAIDVFRLESTA